MKKAFQIIAFVFASFFTVEPVFAGIIIVSEKDNPILMQLEKNRVRVYRAVNLMTAVSIAKKGDGLLLLDQMNGQDAISPELTRLMAKKHLKVFVQYPFFANHLKPDTQTIKLERVVITSKDIAGVDSLAILSVNDHIFYRYDQKKRVLASLAGVAGFDRAEYGLKDVTVYPFLFEEGGMLFASANISDWTTSRYGPQAYWQRVWDYIFSHVGIEAKISWIEEGLVSPALARNETVESKDYVKALKDGADWYLNSKLLIAGQWSHLVDSFTRKNGEGVVFPAVSDSFERGDGSWGILEGHASYISKDGSQPVRWWLRSDCQAETALALSRPAKYISSRNIN